MTSTLAYKPGFAEVIAGLRLLYERRAGDRIFATMEIPSPTLATMRACLTVLANSRDA